jgi:hypothetical protein
MFTVFRLLWLDQDKRGFCLDPQLGTAWPWVEGPINHLGWPLNLHLHAIHHSAVGVFNAAHGVGTAILGIALDDVPVDMDDLHGHTIQPGTEK